MSVRQYIGARYIPLIMGEWDSTKAYEPLSVVTHQGNSYTSRQAVPVGVAITDESYWAVTSIYNSQVEAYRQEVQTFDGRITANADDIDTLEGNLQTVSDDVTALDGRLDAIEANSWITTPRIQDEAVTEPKIASAFKTKIANDIAAATAKKHMVVIGDSFSTTAYSTATNMWWNGVAHEQYLTVHNYAVSGTGFIHASSAANNFNIQVQRAIDDTAFENADVRLVIIFGGLNDRGEATSTNVYNSAAALLNTVKTNFPWAKIILAGCNTYQTIDSYAVVNITAQLRRAAYARGVAFVNTLYALVGSDLVSEQYLWHPNDNGQLALASLFNSAIHGMQFVYDRRFTPEITFGSGTLQLRIENNSFIAFGTIRTNENGQYEAQFPYGSGYLAYQPIFAFAPTAAQPVIGCTWNYATGSLTGTGTPNTTYTVSHVLQTF